MTSETTLVEGARHATGDPAIEVAGLFMPRGYVGRTLLGSMAGSVLGEAIDGEVGDQIGSALGAVAGGASATHDAKGIRFSVAVSPTKIYILRPATLAGVHREAYTLMHTFERADVEVSVKARASMRKLIIHDHTSDERLELEGSRLWFERANAVIHALVITGHDHDHTNESETADT